MGTGGSEMLHLLSRRVSCYVPNTRKPFVVHLGLLPACSPYPASQTRFPMPPAPRLTQAEAEEAIQAQQAQDRRQDIHVLGPTRRVPAKPRAAAARAARLPGAAIDPLPLCLICLSRLTGRPGLASLAWLINSGVCTLWRSLPPPDPCRGAGGLGLFAP